MYIAHRVPDRNERGCYLCYLQSHWMIWSDTSSPTTLFSYAHKPRLDYSPFRRCMHETNRVQHGMVPS